MYTLLEMVDGGVVVAVCVYRFRLVPHQEFEEIRLNSQQQLKYLNLIMKMNVFPFNELFIKNPFLFTGTECVSRVVYDTFICYTLIKT